jgi:hypothetical protein
MAPEISGDTVEDVVGQQLDDEIELLNAQGN